MLLEPNEARVVMFFGKYKGTFYETGFWWINPFMGRKKISVRARNLNVEPIKVNDKNGNPVMIGLVLTMICCIILGMGVPTTANYCIMRPPVPPS